MAEEQFRIRGGLTVGDVEIVNPNGEIVAQSIVNQLAQLTDVDLSSLVNDGVLMYNASTGKWVVTKQFDNHEINAGHY